DPSEDSSDHAKEFIRTLLRESGQEPQASETIDKLLGSEETEEKVLKTLRSVLRDDDDRISRAAARALVLRGEVADANIPLALLQRGQGWYEERGKIREMLDELRSRPLIGVALMESLQQALWAPEEDRAWSAAAYSARRSRS